MLRVRAEVLTIGDELLLGQVVDTNAPYLARQLSEAGFLVVQTTTVGDDAVAIRQALAAAEQRAEAILITGGLGPTRDDLTKAVLADYFESELAEHPDALHHLIALFAQRGKTLSALNRQQAILPVKAQYVVNPTGTAPGMWFERAGKVTIAMPGVPSEMKIMMQQECLPRLRAHFQPTALLHRVVRTIGVGESTLAPLLDTWETHLPPHIRLAYLPAPGRVKLRLSGHGPDSGQLMQEMDEALNALPPAVQPYVYSYEDLEIEEALGQELKTRGLTLATAESCTGGYIGHRLTSIAGSSAYVRGGVIAYDNEVKISQLGVSPDVLQAHGAVSEPVVRIMATEVCRRLGAHLGVACSGVAGPGGGTPEKPVGTVWIACAYGARVETRKLQLTTERLLNIELTAVYALQLAWQMVRAE
ncbi:nicotinamide-nucleotide amidase [Catalinimonas alkaloidigena]|uniref:CinA-like protein n=1 Tax=Catalinimonas alkaloidigena TaxID=1075417 RepID=A0A1G9Q4L5_9BACT|nr:competence/damage-inducible protein A [Catalinimonas alkaloidigena]SDM05447.1 nicotinamide-nucleotide amidase [Catalinimonas alkaloidigena]